MFPLYCTVIGSLLGQLSTICPTFWAKSLYFQNQFCVFIIIIKEHTFIYDVIQQNRWRFVTSGVNNGDSFCHSLSGRLRSTNSKATRSRMHVVMVKLNHNVFSGWLWSEVGQLLTGQLPVGYLLILIVRSPWAISWHKCRREKISSCLPDIFPLWHEHGHSAYRNTHSEHEFLLFSCACLCVWVWVKRGQLPIGASIASVN